MIGPCICLSTSIIIFAIICMLDAIFVFRAETFDRCLNKPIKKYEKKFITIM